MSRWQRLGLTSLLIAILLTVTLTRTIPGYSSGNAQQVAAFLRAPYYGTTSVTPIFDHDRNGGRILALTGAAAQANNCPCPDAPPGGCVDPNFTLGYYSCDIHDYRMDRLMAALGAEPVEWSYKVDCCGASLSLSRSQVVVTLSSRLAREAQEAGADVIACACGMCQINLDTRQNLETKIPALYFTELMGLAFGLPGVEKWWGKHMIDPRPALQKVG